MFNDFIYTFSRLLKLKYYTFSRLLMKKRKFLMPSLPPSRRPASYSRFARQRFFRRMKRNRKRTAIKTTTLSVQENMSLMA